MTIDACAPALGRPTARVDGSLRRIEQPNVTGYRGRGRELVHGKVARSPLAWQ